VETRNSIISILGEEKTTIQSVTEEQLSKLFDDVSSKTLKNLLIECCKLAPSNRSSFSKIRDKYEKSQPQILKKLDLTETLIETIWKKALKKTNLPQTTKEIDFKQFYDFLVNKYFKLQKKPEESHYLKEALRLPFLLKPGEPDPNFMTRDNFGILARLFKFTKKSDDTFITRIVEVFKAEWFYGFVDRNDAQKQLEFLANKKKSNYTYFIVRFANSKQFCFTYKKEANWENSNIDSEQVLKVGGYAKYVSTYQLKVLKHEPILSLHKAFVPFKPDPKTKT